MLGTILGTMLRTMLWTMLGTMLRTMLRTMLWRMLRTMLGTKPKCSLVWKGRIVISVKCRHPPLFPNFLLVLLLVIKLLVTVLEDRDFISGGFILLTVEKCYHSPMLLQTEKWSKQGKQLLDLIARPHKHCWYGDGGCRQGQSNVVFEAYCYNFII